MQKTSQIWTKNEELMDFLRSCIKNEITNEKEKRNNEINWNNGNLVIFPSERKTTPPSFKRWRFLIGPEARETEFKRRQRNLKIKRVLVHVLHQEQQENSRKWT